MKWGLQVIRKFGSWIIGDGRKAKIASPWVKGKQPALRDGLLQGG